MPTVKHGRQKGRHINAEKTEWLSQKSAIDTQNRADKMATNNNENKGRSLLLRAATPETNDNVPAVC